MNQNLLAWLTQIFSPISPQTLTLGGKKMAGWDKNMFSLLMNSYEVQVRERMPPSAVLFYSKFCEVLLF